MKRMVAFLLLSLLIALSGCTKELYNITFQTNGGSSIETVEVVEESLLSIPSAPTKIGHDFVGWYRDYGLAEEYNFSEKVESDFILFAKWEKIDYTITYHIDNEETEEDVYHYNEVLEYLIPTIIGERFLGWYTDDEFTDLYEDLRMGTEDIELFAKWEPIVCELGYSLNGETNLCEPIVCELGTQLNMTMTACEPILCDQGYILDGNECVRDYSQELGERIDILTWTGSGTYYADLGHLDLVSQELYTATEAYYYAIAKEFNEIHPDVVINLLALPGGPSDGGRNWQNEIYQYTMNYGAAPNIFTTDNLPGNVTSGIVADLSRFTDDPLYQTLSPGLMYQMNYYGFQAGLPSYVLPWGIYVNRELAAEHDIMVPGIDWTIDEYTAFIGNSLENVYYGSMDAPIRIIETGTTTMNYSLLVNQSGPEYINLNSDEVRSLIPYINTWFEHSVYGGSPNQTFMAEHWNWSYKFFADNTLLTLESDPWMMVDCANDSGSSLRCASGDWDIYPRPSTDFQNTTIGLVLDPMAVYNSCLDDGDISCTLEEEAQIELAYQFAVFSIADTNAMMASAAQMYYNLETSSFASALKTGFPVTIGTAFDEQMALWYSVGNRQRFSDSSLMPGFQEVLRIYEEGRFWDVSDKTYPYYSTEAGLPILNLNEWKQYWNPENTNGVPIGSPGYTDAVLQNLQGWNELANNRFAESFEDLKNSLWMYYGFNVDDMN